MRIAHVVPTIVKKFMTPTTRSRALFLRGKSGIGKSDAVKQASDMLAKYVEGWQGVIDVRLSQCDPVDLRGVPVPKDGVTEWLPPSFLPRSGSGILFLDELTSAPPAVQAAAYQLILDRRLGEYVLPEGFMVVAAGNYQSDRGVTYPIAAPLLNRMTVVDVETTLDDFFAYAVRAGVRPEVLAFLRDRPDYLHRFDPSDKTNSPFPSPRSWVSVSNTLGLELPDEVRLELIRGDVGYEAGVAFEAYLREFADLPRIDDILSGKDVPVPSDLSKQYCIGMGLAARMSPENFEEAWAYLQRLNGEVQLLTLRLAAKRDKALTKVPTWKEVLIKFQDAFRLG